MDNASSKKKCKASQHHSAKASLLGPAAKVAPHLCKVAQAGLSRKQRQKLNRRLNQLQLHTRAALAQKIIVSNLPPDVTEAQLQELFAYSIGPTVQVALHRDDGGRSTGNAIVVFSRSGDATRALEEYNNRLIDGNVMKVELVLDTSPLPHEPALSRRIGPTPTASQGTGPPLAPQQLSKTPNKHTAGKWRGGKNQPNINLADALAAEMASLLRLRDQAKIFLKHFGG